MTWDTKIKAGLLFCEICWRDRCDMPAPLQIAVCQCSPAVFPPGSKPSRCDPATLVRGHQTKLTSLSTVVHSARRAAEASHRRKCYEKMAQLGHTTGREQELTCNLWRLSSSIFFLDCQRRPQRTLFGQASCADHIGTLLLTSQVPQRALSRHGHGSADVLPLLFPHLAPGDALSHILPEAEVCCPCWQMPHVQADCHLAVLQSTAMRCSHRNCNAAFEREGKA
jgi:hypothetical protein